MGIRTSRTDYVYRDFRNLAQFGGTIRYVSTTGSDTNNGTDPTTPLKTIAAAIAASSAGDAISLKSGTYTDVGLDMNLDGLELWAEIGATITPATGVALTVSGDSCRVDGELTVNGVAGQVAVLVTGDDCVFNKTKIADGTYGICITGTGTALNLMAVGFQTSYSYEISNDQTRLYRCNSVGGGATTGFLIDNGASTGVLQECTSSSNATSSFYIDTGSSNWTMLNCSSGGGDGRWADVDNANTWSGFLYDSEKMKLITLDASAATKEYNLFKITGQVKISQIYAHVETVLSNNHTNCHLDLWDGSTSVPLSDTTGLGLNSAPVGSSIVRNADVSNMLDYQSSTACFVSENASYRDPTTEIIVGQKGDGSDTYVRFVHTTSNTPSSGALHWHIHWEPINGEGFVEEA